MASKIRGYKTLFYVILNIFADIHCTLVCPSLTRDIRNNMLGREISIKSPSCSFSSLCIWIVSHFFLLIFSIDVHTYFFLFSIGSDRKEVKFFYYFFFWRRIKFPGTWYEFMLRTSQKKNHLDEPML